MTKYIYSTAMLCLLAATYALGQANSARLKFKEILPDSATSLEVFDFVNNINATNHAGAKIALTTNALRLDSIVPSVISEKYLYKYNANNQAIEEDRMTQTAVAGGIPQYHVQEKNIYSYDSVGNNTGWITQVWDTATNSLVNTTNFARTYNQIGKVTSAITYYYSDNAWKEQYGYLYTYDSLGNLATFKEIRWNYYGNNWDTQFIYSYTYNNNKLTNSLLYVYYSSYTNSVKTTYQYNAQNQLIEVVDLWSSSPTLSSYTGHYKNTYSYNVAGLQTECIRYVGVPGSVSNWVPELKWTYEYNNLGYKTVEIMQKYNKNINSWYNYDKRNYDVDINGNVLLDAYSYAPTTTSPWVCMSKRQYVYDTNTLTASTSLPPYFLYGFESLNIVTARLYHQFNETTSTWSISLPVNYFYTPPSIVTSTKTASTLQASLFPNPATNVLNVQLSGNATEGQISLYDAQGRRVLNQSVSAQQSTLDLQALPQGMYFYRLQTDGQKLQTGKVVKL